MTNEPGLPIARIPLDLPSALLPVFLHIANSDFHEAHHLYSWKTLLRCEKNVEAIKAEIRSDSGVSIYLLRPGKQPRA